MGILPISFDHTILRIWAVQWLARYKYRFTPDNCMRISELLLEYRRDVTQQKLAKELGVIADNEKTTPEDVLEQVEAIDPTKNKQYVLWLVKQLVKKQFRLEDAPRVTELLNNFISIKPRLPVDQRDIGRFDFYKLDDLVDKTLTPDMDQGKANTGLTSIPDTKVLYNGPLGQLVIPLTRDASCALGKNTSWCTARDDINNMFNQYNKEGPLYVWIGKDGKRYQFHFESAQCMDSKDRPIDEKTINYFRLQHPVLSKLFAKGERGIIDAGDLEAINYYAEHTIKGRWPEAEPYIMEDSYEAVQYAINAIKGRWPEAEPYIMQDAASAVDYARNVVHGRWPEAEKSILADGHPSDLVNYALVAGMTRWEAAEPIIYQYPSPAASYQIHVIGARKPDIEDLIKQSKFAWEIYTAKFPDAA